jgi:hypothetical protein
MNQFASGRRKESKSACEVYFRGAGSPMKEYSFKGPNRRRSAYMRQRLHTIRKLAMTGMER